MKTIKYQGVKYKTNLKEDEQYAGGVWDLSGKVASEICTITDPANYEHYEEIQELIYNLIKHDILGSLGPTMG